MSNTFNSGCPNAPAFFNLQTAARNRSIAQQSADHSDTVSTQAEHDDLEDIPQTFEELPRITIPTKQGRREYVKAELLNSQSERRSWIWAHGYDIVDVKTKESYWRCTICDDRGRTNGLYKATSTGGAISHLLSEHRIKEPKRKRGVDNEDEDIDSASETATPLDTPAGVNVYDMLKSAAKSAKSLLPKTLVGRFKHFLIQWIVCYQVALSAVENQQFRDLIALCSASLVACLPSSGNTVRRWIIDSFEARKAAMITDIQSNINSAIHVSFDLWTSGNSLAFMAVVIHYIDKQYKNRTRLIAMKRVHGSHSGVHQAEIIIQILEEYKLTDRLGYFISDNASSCDTCIDSVLEQLKPALTSGLRVQRRLRCYGHVLNLAANAFLFGKNPSSFDAELVTNNILQSEQAQLLTWRKKGPVGKLHNVVVFIRRSTQRREQFSDLADDDAADLELVQDNATRWNSAFVMIQRALLLIDRLVAWISNNSREKDAKKRLPKDDILSNEDWRILTETSVILEPFYNQTIRYQSRAKNGDHGALWELYLAIELLLNHIIHSKLQYTDFEITKPGPDDDEISTTRKHIRTSLDNCWGKLDEYYSKLDFSPVYAASVVLHPGYKWLYFEKQWIEPHQKLWLEPTKAAVREFWEENYKYMPLDEAERQPQPFQVPSPRPPRHIREPNSLAEFVPPPNFYDDEAVANTRDEYEEYLSKPARPCNNPLEWWRAHRQEYPRLSQMALDLFSIPMMSAECERVFSSAKNLITDRRNGLKEDIIEACTLLRHWFRDPEA